MASEDDKTDNIILPSTAPTGKSVPVVLTVGAENLSGNCISLRGEQVTVLVDRAVPVDTEVAVASEGPAAANSVGVVVWSRASDGQTALGIEIIGGAADWVKVMAD